VDEHVGSAIVHGLRRRGLDVVTVTEAGMRGKNDHDQLAFALNTQRVIFTQDRDFLRLATSVPMLASCTQGVPIGTIVSGLLLIYNVLSAEEMMGNVEYI
jgi:hypothetical protein